MINVKKEVFLKKLFLFLCVFGQQKNRTNEAVGGSKGTGCCVGGGGSEKGAHALQDRLPAKDFGRNYPENRNKIF